MTDRPNDPRKENSQGKSGADAIAGAGANRWVAVFSVEPGKLIYRVNKTRIVIGSVVSSDIHLNGPGVAPIHAVIEVTKEPGAHVATIFDLGSEAGLMVNGKKSVTQSLKSGDELQIGAFKLKFSVEDVQRATSSSTARVRDSGGQKLFVNPSEDLAPLLLENERDVEEIFDYRPSAKQALEVVMSWNDTILDVQHFVDAKEVRIGSTRKCDFGIPPVLSQSVEFNLVTLEGDGYTLNLDTKMTGLIQKNGELRKITSAGAAQRMALAKDDFAKLSVGDVDFYLSYTVAPPTLKRKRLLDRDPFLFKVLTTSLLFTIALIVTLLNLKVPQVVEVEEVPERIATILYQPEKFSEISGLKTHSPEAEPVKPQPPKPQPQKTFKVDIKPSKQDPNKPIPRVIDVGNQGTKGQQTNQHKNQTQRSQSEGREGRGARAKGTEGERGNPKAAPGKEHQTSAKRPSPEGGKGRGGGKSQVPDEGNLDFMKGAGEKIQNILGNSGERLGKGGGDLQGFGGFDTQGKGGSGLTGTGKGGGGDAASLGGLSDRGRGGGRVGTGMGAAGSGTSLVGGKSRVVLRTGGPEETVVMGSIDASAIERAILAHRDEFKLCYEREINAGNPKLAGRVTTTFVIGSSGRVNEAGVASSSLKNGNAEKCILNVIKRIDFPMPNGGGVVQVTYPFKFTPVAN